MVGRHDESQESESPCGPRAAVAVTAIATVAITASVGRGGRDVLSHERGRGQLAADGSTPTTADRSDRHRPGDRRPGDRVAGHGRRRGRGGGPDHAGHRGGGCDGSLAMLAAGARSRATGSTTSSADRSPGSASGSRVTLPTTCWSHECSRCVVRARVTGGRRRRPGRPDGHGSVRSRRRRQPSDCWSPAACAGTGRRVDHAGPERRAEYDGQRGPGRAVSGGERRGERPSRIGRVRSSMLRGRSSRIDRRHRGAQRRVPTATPPPIRPARNT